jgi:hypothetical protein
MLGMDVIKDFNPKIQNLNWIYPGQEILVPPLARETLLRKQPDGSYRIIAASFTNRTAGRCLHQCFWPRIAITSRFHRVESQTISYCSGCRIDGLKNFEEASRAWDTGVRNQWFAFVREPSDDQILSKADLIY